MAVAAAVARMQPAFRPFTGDGIVNARAAFQSIPIAAVGDSLMSLWGPGRSAGMPARFSQAFSWMDLMERYRDLPLTMESDGFTAAMLNERGNVILQLCAPILQMNENSVTISNTEIYQMPYNLAAAGGVPRSTGYRRETRSVSLRLFKRYFPLEIAYLRDPNFGRQALNDVVGALASQAFLTLAAEASMALVLIPWENMSRQFVSLPAGSGQDSARQVHMEAVGFALAHASPNDLMRLIMSQSNSMNEIDLTILPENAGRLLEGIQGETRSVPAYYFGYDERTESYFRVLYDGPRSLKTIIMGNGKPMDFIENPSYRYSSLDDDPVQTMRAFPVLAEVVLQNARDPEELASGDAADLDVWVHHQTETSISPEALRYVEGLKWCGLWNNVATGTLANGDGSGPGDALLAIIDKYNADAATRQSVRNYLLDASRDNNTPSPTDLKQRELTKMDRFRHYCGFVSVGEAHNGAAFAAGIVPATRIGDLPRRTWSMRHAETAARSIINQGMAKFGLKREEMEMGASGVAVTPKWTNDFRRLTDYFLPGLSWTDMSNVLPTVVAAPIGQTPIPAVVVTNLRTQTHTACALFGQNAGAGPGAAPLLPANGVAIQVGAVDIVTAALNAGGEQGRNDAFAEPFADAEVEQAVFAVSETLLSLLYPLADIKGRDVANNYARLNKVILLNVCTWLLLNTAKKYGTLTMGGMFAAIAGNLRAPDFAALSKKFILKETASKAFQALVLPHISAYIDQGAAGVAYTIPLASIAAGLGANATVVPLGNAAGGARAHVPAPVAVQPTVFHGRVMGAQTRAEYLAAASPDALLAAAASGNVEHDNRWARALRHVPDASVHDLLTFAHGAEAQLEALKNTPDALAAAEGGLTNALEQLAVHGGKNIAARLAAHLAAHVTDGKPLAELADRTLMSTRALAHAEALPADQMAFATRFAAAWKPAGGHAGVDAMDIDDAEPLGFFAGDLARVRAAAGPGVGAAPLRGHPGAAGAAAAAGAVGARAGTTDCMRERLDDMVNAGLSDLTGYMMLALFLARNTLRTHQVLAQRAGIQLLRLNYWRPFQRYRMLSITCMRGGNRTLVTGFGHAIVTPSMEGIEGYVNMTVQFRSGIIPVTPDRMRLLPNIICDKLLSELNCNFVRSTEEFCDDAPNKPSVVALPVPIDETRYAFPMHMLNRNIYKPNDPSGPSVLSKHSAVDVLRELAGDQHLDDMLAINSNADMWQPLTLSFVGHRSCAHYWKSRLGSYISIPGTGPRGALNRNVPEAAGVWSGMAEKFPTNYAPLAINA